MIPFVPSLIQKKHVENSQRVFVIFKRKKFFTFMLYVFLLLIFVINLIFFISQNKKLY